VERSAAFVWPGRGGRLQRVEKLPLLLEAELQVLAGRGESSPVSLGCDSFREGGGRRGGLGSAPELCDEKVRAGLRKT
jgi:hypothetical protein